MKFIQFRSRILRAQRIKFFRLTCALAIAVMGVVSALTALLPTRHDFALLSGIFDQFAPFALPIMEPFNYTRSSMALIVGFFLIFTALGIAKGKRRAWQLTIVLLPLSVLVHLTRGLDIVYVLLILALWCCFVGSKQFFRVESDPTQLRRGFTLLLLGFVFLACYGLSGFYILRHQFFISSAFSNIVRLFLYRIVNLPAGKVILLTAHTEWFLQCVLWLSGIGLLTGLVTLLRPVSARWWVAHQQERGEYLRQRTNELVGRYGRQTLAFFTLVPENLHYLTTDEEGLVSYRLAGNTAVVLGDSICPPKAFEQVTRNFLNLCETHDWCPTFFQTHAEHISTYRALGLHAFKIGEEAMLDLQTFTLSGSAMANVRCSVRRAEREGLQIEWYEGVPSQTVLERLHTLSQAWLEHKAGKNATEMGFSMGRLSELEATGLRSETVAEVLQSKGIPPKEIPRFVIGMAINQAGQVCAFVTFTPIYGERTLSDDGIFRTQNWGWALDLVRRGTNAPPGVIELLLVRAIERFSGREAQVLSLGMVALADTQQEMTHNQRQVTGFISGRLRLLETHRSLFQFKQKFHPRWESRYIITATTLHLLKSALVLLQLMLQV